MIHIRARIVNVLKIITYYFEIIRRNSFAVFAPLLKSRIIFCNCAGKHASRTKQIDAPPSNKARNLHFCDPSVRAK